MNHFLSQSELLRTLVIVLIALTGCIPTWALTQKEVFGDAKWIGVDSEHLTFYPYAQTVFSLQWEASSKHDSWVRFGTGDERLEDKYKNIWHLEFAPGESYVQVSVNPTEGNVEIETKNMGPKNERRTLVFPSELKDKLKYKTDSDLAIRLDVLYGYTEVYVNNVLLGKVNLNQVIGDMSQVRYTGDFLAFPILGDVSWSDNVSEVSIYNALSPKNLLARLDVKPICNKAREGNGVAGEGNGVSGTSKEAPQYSQTQLRH